MRMRMLFVNGPNLNLLGKRDPDIYGRRMLSDINADIEKKADSLGISCDFFQSNSEGAIIDALQQASKEYDAVIINAGAYSHYSIAIRDCIEAIDIPCFEVHISNIYSREEFRRTSVISPVCTGCICGCGEYGYQLALMAAADHIERCGMKRK